MKNNKEIRPFHLAIPVSDLQRAKVFYVDILGCTTGRVDKKWIDLNFFNHQLVLHQRDGIDNNNLNRVDGKDVPVPHFGVILEWKDWHNFADRIQDRIDFIIEPYIRFKGQVGEQATMFFNDPDRNAIELKAFKDDSYIFKYKE